MESEKTLICFDANNWLDCIFWNNNADLQLNNNPWEGLQYSDQTVGKFVRAACSSNYMLVAVATGGASGPEAREKYQWRREQEILDEKRGVCLGASLFLQESFEKQGVRVVRPIDADVNDVLAALAGAAIKHKGAVVVSRNRSLFNYDIAIPVCRGFTVRGGKLILERTVTRDDVWWPRRDTLTVQPHLALVAMGDEEKWSQRGHVTVYRPSLKKEGRIERGTTSSSDKKMGNLHALARPLRAAVYAILGEHSALERIPEWSKDEKMVVWTETKVVADPTLSSVLEDPLSVVKWLVERDTPVQQLEPWREAERIFNICALAAELVAVSSHGAWTMHKCMDLFSKEAEIIKRTTNHCAPSSPPARPPGNIIDEQEAAGSRIIVAEKQHTSLISIQDVRGHHALKQVSDAQVGHPNEPMQHQTLKPNLPSVALSTSRKSEVLTQGTSSRVRESIFGSGRPREQVLKGRGARNMDL